jgi:carbonic anhydrase/acetyltransferase-like protein (isoleucine patch superfamily)
MPVYSYRGVWPTVAEDAFIAPTAVLIGDVTVEAGASVWFGAVIRGDVAPIHIGARSNVQDNCVLHADEGIPCAIGADCALGHGAVVHGATIGEHTLIGMRATVLNSAEVGAECIIAAGTVIPEGKRIESGQLVMGVPGKVVRSITEAERERIYDGVKHYAERAQEYRRMLAEQRQAGDR